MYAQSALFLPMPQHRFKPHLTVSAVIERAGLFLLVEERTAAGLMLNTPAGHVERGEHPVHACVREVQEETTYGFTPTALVGLYLHRARPANTGVDTTWLRMAFCGHLGERRRGARLDRGIERTVWMSAQEIADSRARHRSPSVWQSVQDYLRGQRFDLSLIYAHETLFQTPALQIKSQSL